MRGNSHVRFLGGGGAVMRCCYLTFEAFGFEAIALLAFLLPLLVLAYLARMPAVAPHPHAAQATFGSVMHAVWLLGLGAALASTDYCTILTFSSLYYSAMNWQSVWMAFTAFGVALIFVLVQAAGIFLIWLASTSLIATTGAAFTPVKLNARQIDTAKPKDEPYKLSDGGDFTF